MADKDKLVLQAMSKLLKQMKEMQTTLETMSESVDLLVKIETDRIKKEGS